VAVVESLICSPILAPSLSEVADGQQEVDGGGRQPDGSGRQRTAMACGCTGRVPPMNRPG
jgi:hypothetical protein